MSGRKGRARGTPKTVPGGPDAGLQERLALAQEAARRGAEVLRRRFGTIDFRNIEKKGPKDFVTAVDLEAEEAVVGFLESQTPDLGIVAEERPERPSADGLSWVIDPLDGTTNYVHQYPFFAVSVALVQGNTPLVGVVLDPLRNEEFTALRGGGAFLNGDRIQTSAVRSLSSALMLTGFPFRAIALLGSYIRSFEAVLRSTVGVRRDGSAALDLCHVACGRADGFWELRLSPWDIAAGHLLVEEAGGRSTDFVGGNSQWHTGDILASNGHLHTTLIRLLRESFPGYR
ncbi:MAG: inositol monophosphatase family protein [Acidobacteriota bacterium]|nr:inositol monophosphatase family protein [Acidobacteriota bacterium]